MRALAIALVLASLVGTARGGDGDDDDDDEDGEFVPARKLSIAIGMGGHGTRVGGIPETGFGTTLELALGRHRWQYFVEGGLSISRRAPAGSLVEAGGRLFSAGVGARWIARQFRPSSSGGVELFLLSRAGFERFYFDDNMRVSRPELALGVGMQVRSYRRARLGFRLDMRVLLSPSDGGMAGMDSTTGFAAAGTVLW